MSSRLTDVDAHLFNEGRHLDLHDRLGAHSCRDAGVTGTRFGVWAPSARSVRVAGDFNDWDNGAAPLAHHNDTGIWEGFVAGVDAGALYKYIVETAGGELLEKADPLASRTEEPPRTASVVWDLDYDWGDSDWLAARTDRNGRDQPISIYEVHLGSWVRVTDPSERFATYRELAVKLAQYAQGMGYTHVELLPVMEHPFYGSWGYQVTGYFAPTARYGSPQDLMFLIDTLHQHGVGVILDWVPAHFPTDSHGLFRFDGTACYEQSDHHEGIHPDWHTAIFNYGRHEVRSFLLSSALFWIDRYHADGLRVDAVASMLYRDYSRKKGEWVPNRFGGRENLEAIDFLKQLNDAVHARCPGALTIAEESTAWAGVSGATPDGLGFDLKWDMGWMHDTLQYLARDPIHRSHHHNEITFRMLYAFDEYFLLPLSHDEVVHEKKSLLGKMPGDPWQQRANLRLLFGYQYAQPGKKLLFMGGELGLPGEWDHEQCLDWRLGEVPEHDGIRNWLRDLNRLYASEPALHQRDAEARGFEWIDANDDEGSVLSFVRRGHEDEPMVLVVINGTPVPREKYGVGVPCGGRWHELLNSDAEEYGGSGVGNLGSVLAEPTPMHGRRQSLTLTLPPLAVLFLRSPIR